ncbi:agmatine deiminase [Brevibacterium sanguinis]|uniref:Agmatine deiminase n=2 Tax=Brevibacterium TaxID=1696 RepID=A0A366ILE7_9MICO|nr:MULTISPECIES: agmatine deiminase family protein [Brevibacterium]RBP67012.1 agmatine deiminase [Brevibacterium sanguinis]RBP73537.1 agmatine deiminase [Brevibacterium celere]
MSYLMPAETAPHDRIWMAFPSSGYALGDTEDDAEAARRTWAAVARATSEFTPVTVVVSESQTEHARRHLGEGITHPISIVNAELDDAWMRDIGPTYVFDDEGRLHAVDWVFNGWGAQTWAKWDHDQHIGRTVAELSRTPIISSELRNEGGGIHVDGQGTVLATRSVQLDPGRNPELTEADVEAEFARTIGAKKVIWLDRGLHRDNQTFGTRGHVDIVATMPSPGVVLVHDQRDPEHPDHAFSQEVKAQFARETTADGRPFEVIAIPAPTTLRDDEGWVDYSYVNHLVTNGGVIACTFDDPMDAEAVAILEQVYPGRKVVGVDARELYARGGGIHCITQQQPTPA